MLVLLLVVFVSACVSVICELLVLVLVLVLLVLVLVLVVLVSACVRVPTYCVRLISSRFSGAEKGNTICARALAL